MNRIQKISWTFIVTVTFSIIAGLVRFAILYARIGLPGAWKGLELMGLASLGGLSLLIFREDSLHVQADEREKAIHKQAALVGFTMSYLFLGLAWLILSFSDPEATISVRHLHQIFKGALITIFFFYSVTCLLCYGKECKIHE